MNNYVNTVVTILTDTSHLNIGPTVIVQDSIEPAPASEIEQEILDLEKQELVALTRIQEKLDNLHSSSNQSSTPAVPASDSTYLLVTVGKIKIKIKGNLYMAFELNDASPATLLTANVLDAAGFPATLVGTPTWTTSDVDVVSLTPGATALTTVANVGRPGSATVTFEVDGITATFDIHVVGGPAATATIVATVA